MGMGKRGWSTSSQLTLKTNIHIYMKWIINKTTLLSIIFQVCQVTCFSASETATSVSNPHTHDAFQTESKHFTYCTKTFCQHQLKETPHSAIQCLSENRIFKSDTRKNTTWSTETHHNQLVDFWKHKHLLQVTACNTMNGHSTDSWSTGGFLKAQTPTTSDCL